MTDYKQLCAELVEDLALWLEYDGPPSRLPETEDESYRLLQRARAALAEPEPEGPTQRQLLQLAAEFWPEGCEPTQATAYARAVLARWGNHPGSPDSSLQPVPVSERLPGPGDTDPEGRCWWWYPEVPGKTYGYWAYEDDAVPERALNEQPTHWLSVHALPQPS